MDVVVIRDSKVHVRASSGVSVVHFDQNSFGRPQELGFTVQEDTMKGARVTCCDYPEHVGSGTDG